MSRINACSGVLLLAASLVSGCGTPSVKYQVAKPDDYNIKSGSIVFALRGSDITLIPSSVKVADACPTSKPAATVTREAWTKCLTAAALQVTPTVDGQTVYVANPADTSPLAHTRLAATFLNDDPTNIETVTVAFSDNTSQFVTSVGSGAIGGLAFGPGGAIVGGLIGAGGAISSNQWLSYTVGGPPAPAAWQDMVCDDTELGDKSVYLRNASNLPLAVSLPYAMKLSSSGDACWHALPKSASEEVFDSSSPAFPWSGWVFRLRLGEQPKGSQVATSYFDGNGKRETFPYVPCQSAEVDVAWWTELKTAAEGKTTAAYRTFLTKVANPAYIRHAALPKGGTIKLGTVCNAQVTFGSYSGSAAQATVDATLKQVTDFKTAQVKAHAAAATAAAAAAKAASGPK